MIDYRYIKAFLLTAEFKSFSKAAQKLNIAQSAVSRQIKLLEESLKVELIIRSSKKVLLTQKGEELFRAVHKFEKVTADIFVEDESREISVGLLHGLLENWFNKLIIQFYKKNIRNVRIHVDTPSNLKQMLADGKLDIILTNENIQSEIISSLKLFDEKLSIISKNEIDTSKLQDYRWVVYHSSDNMYKVSKKVSDQIITVDSITTIKSLVKSGVGIAVVPDHILEKGDSIKKYNHKNLPKSEIFLGTLNYQQLPKYISTFIDQIKAHDS